jgi:cell division protein FtsB
MPAPKARKYSPSLLVVMIAGTITLFFMVSIVRELVQAGIVSQQVSRLRQEVAQAQGEQQRLADLLSYLNSPTFQERQARLQLGEKKAGERVIIVPDANTNALVADRQSESELANAELSNPARWWQYFFSSKK